MSQVFLPFGLSLLVALCLTPIARQIALRVGCMDPVVNRSMHHEPKPYLGGVAIYVAFAIAVLAVAQPLDKGLVGILICGGLILVIGLVDDFLRPTGIPAKYKFALQALVAAILVVGFDVRVLGLGTPFADKLAWFPLSGWISIPLSIFWIISFTNVVNLIDGLDGLAAGISTIGALTLFLVALHQGQMITMVLTAALAGSAIGFLRYNFNPAKIFMGDAGALFLGFALGAVSIHGVLKSAATVGIVVPVLALGLPIFDTAFAIVRRVVNGRSIGEADRDHLHHRLIRMGLSVRSAVLVMWVISAWLGLSAVAVSEVASTDAVILVSVVVGAMIFGALKLGLLGVDVRRRNVNS